MNLSCFMYTIFWWIIFLFLFFFLLIDLFWEQAKTSVWKILYSIEVNGKTHWFGKIQLKFLPLSLEEIHAKRIGQKSRWRESQCLFATWLICSSFPDSLLGNRLSSMTSRSFVCLFVSYITGVSNSSENIWKNSEKSLFRKRARNDMSCFIDR